MKKKKKQNNPRRSNTRSVLFVYVPFLLFGEVLKNKKEKLISKEFKCDLGYWSTDYPEPNLTTSYVHLALLLDSRFGREAAINC